ncbi:uncharacterized protein LOC143374677 [Andrena cerasifolii]|uniref:uncharacterized protein LOC143374677 n=1 Tax=Andrena cerasifolii TaxID=2819439 RepID=UPI004037EED9
MSAFQQQYKSKPIKFIDARGGRNIRAVEYEESRKKQRADVINGKRNIPNGSANVSQQEEPQSTASMRETRLLRLLSWKAERDMNKKMTMLKKKRPFLTGIVHHRIYSPISHNDKATGTSMQHQKVRKPIMPATPPKRITRATEKRLLSKACTQGSTIITKTLNSTGSKEQKNRKKQQSIAPNNHKFKPPAGLHCVQLFGRVDPHSTSPLRLSEIVPTSRRRGASRKGESIGLCSGHFNTTSHDASLVDKETDIDNAEESSESLRLKLSSDEDEQPNSFRNSSKNGSPIARSNNKAEAENEVIDNNSVVEEALLSPSNNTTITPSPTEPAFFSPYIVSSRGKRNARKEQQLRRGFSIGPSPGSDIPTKDTVMKNLNISIEDEERTAQYFQFLLNREIKRLNELCEEWAAMKDEPTITEDAQYLIHQAIGQTKLLICKKFERFRGLVTDCETGKGEMLVTCKDLQGFWDMMYMQIRDCDTRFEKLEKLRTQGWKEDEPPVSKSIGKKKATMRKKKVVSTKPSSLRAFLREKKKKLSQKTEDKDDAGELNVTNHGTLNNTSDKTENSPSGKYRTRSTSGSVGLDKRRFTPSNTGQLKSNLLVKVQLSDRERMRSPLTVIKVSQMCKTPDVQLDNSISYINSDQTPIKSILKPSKTLTKENSSMKSTYTVNFNDNVCLNEVPVDEEVQTKLDLATALARIDSFDLDSIDQEVPINSAKQLNFDDSSSEEAEGDHDAKEYSGLRNSVGDNTSQSTSYRSRFPRQDALDESNETTDKISLVNITPFVLVTKIKGNAELDALKLESGKYTSIKEERTYLHNESVRVLRNRSIIQTNDEPIDKISLKKVAKKLKEPEQKENKTPSKAKRKSSLKVRSKDNENRKSELESAMDNMDLNGNSDNRRYTRRSVKFSEKECNGSIENKQVLPMTPHVRASSSRLQSIEKKRRSKISEDLISWDTPEKLPARIRRSQNRRASSSLI